MTPLQEISTKPQAGVSELSKTGQHTRSYFCPMAGVTKHTVEKDMS